MAAKYDDTLAHDDVNQLKITDLLGTWVLRKDTYDVYSFELTEENITDVEDLNKEIHNITKCHNIGHCSDQIIGAVELPVELINFKQRIRPWYIRLISNNTYRHILHRNGVIRYYPVSDSIFDKIFLARIDSKGWWDTVKNLYHGSLHGCYCFAVLKKDKRTVIRYNRWMNQYPDYFLMMSKK